MKKLNQDLPQVLIVAGEASSSLYAQRLLEHWKDSGVALNAFGVGSQPMEALGFERLGCAEDMAVMGLQEVVSHYSFISGVFKKVVSEARLRKPKFALLLDYSGFNLRLAKKLKELNIPVVYYISPQLWAWRTGRIRSVQKYVDKMLVVFPFEESFYKRHNVNVEFVGHPIVDEVSEKHDDPAVKKELRQRFGIGENDVLLGLMPGSRKSEIKYNLITQIMVAEKLVKKNSNLCVGLLIAPGLDVEYIKAMIPQTDLSLIIISMEPFDMIQMTDVVLCASGTATIMVGLLKKPMVIMYRMNTITAWLAKKLVKSTKYFGMVNLILDRLVVPEKFQEEANVDDLAEALQPFVSSSNLRSSVADELQELRLKLGSKGATKRVIKYLNEFLK